MDRKQTIKAALEIIHTNVYTVEAAWVDGLNPATEDVERFERAAYDHIDQAKEDDLERVYDFVLQSTEDGEPVSPGTLLCYLGDEVSDIEGLRVYSINVETDR